MATSCNSSVACEVNHLAKGSPTLGLRPLSGRWCLYEKWVAGRLLRNATNELMIDEIVQRTWTAFARHDSFQRAGRYELESLTATLAARISGLTLTMYCDFVMEGEHSGKGKFSAEPFKHLFFLYRWVKWNRHMTTFDPSANIKNFWYTSILISSFWIIV